MPKPLRFARKWRRENTWLVFSPVALLVLPAGPHLPWGRIFESVLIFSDLLPSLAFGLLWDGQATFGIAGVRMVMAFALAVETGTVLGSIVPLAVLHPEAFAGTGTFLSVAPGEMKSIVLIGNTLGSARQAAEESVRDFPMIAETSTEAPAP